MSPSPENAQENDVGFDPDEDLFAFGNPASNAPPEGAEHEEPEDLEEIFASFEEEEARARELAPPAAAIHELLEPDHVGHGGTAPRSRDVARATPPSPPKAVHGSAAQAPRRTVAASVAPQVSEPALSTHGVERAPEPAARTRRAKALSATSLAILTAVVLVNALVALVTLRTAADLQAKLAGKASHAAAAEHAARPDATAPTSTEPARDGSDAAEVEALPPDPEAHPVFEGVRQDLARGDYGAARRRLYALLAVIDRLDPSSRREVEARAHYALARARHLEAVERMEVGR